MDIETISLQNHDKLQIPVLISTTNSNSTHLFTINIEKLNIAINNKDIVSINKLVDQLWIEYLDFKKKNKTKTTFVHNLGSFDGLFLYKGLLNIVNINNLSTIIDTKNKFILIKYKDEEGNIFIWKDSYRIFPVKLNDLCKNFNVEGKFSVYNQEFNDISVFTKPSLLEEFLSYSKQDSISLFKALIKAQDLYIDLYQVDITSIFSTSTLSLKIFRSKFQSVDIPILDRKTDDYIRKAYYGGATDYYKGYGEKLHYYDVNSLYPYAMLKPMPVNFIKYHKDASTINSDLYGYIEVEVTTPENILIPIVPLKYGGKTIFPIGSWRGTYLSDEIKAYKEYGYKFKNITAMEFTKEYIFNDYVDHFFKEKKLSKVSHRFIAKMHLNQLYGYFGRNRTIV